MCSLLCARERECADDTSPQRLLANWTKEYEGALMTAYHTHYRTMYECVDRDAEPIRGTSGFHAAGGIYLYHVEADCSGMLCSPYDPEKELLCVVCTK